MCDFIIHIKEKWTVDFGVEQDAAIVDDFLIDGTYIYQVNSTLSNGEYSGQVGNSTFVRNRKDGLNDVNIVNFPLPILTYTNAFNSLPQPSTAPLPA
jgi:hypothetical protein